MLIQVPSLWKIPYVYFLIIARIPVLIICTVNQPTMVLELCLVLTNSTLYLHPELLGQSPGPVPGFFLLDLLPVLEFPSLYTGFISGCRSLFFASLMPDPCLTKSYSLSPCSWLSCCAVTYSWG